MKLWHCASARSLRPLWTLEEMGIPYELEVLQFPPRIFQRDYLEINSLGTVPYFVDGDTHMTESVAICQYLVDRYQRYDLGLAPSHPEYGAYLNWLQHADATLTFPQTISMRYYYLEPTPEKQAVADDYARWYISRLRRLDAHLQSHEFLVDNRFTIADIAVCYALYLGRAIHFDKLYQPQTAAYMNRLMARPAFKRADAMADAVQLPARE
jgi:glutathione S-transferase